MVKQKICIKKDQLVYNNCYELRSRAINPKIIEAACYLNEIDVDFRSQYLCFYFSVKLVVHWIKLLIDFMCVNSFVPVFMLVKLKNDLTGVNPFLYRSLFFKNLSK